MIQNLSDYKHFNIAKIYSLLICWTAKLYMIWGFDFTVILTTQEVAEAAKHILLNLPDFQVSL